MQKKHPQKHPDEVYAEVVDLVESYGYGVGLKSKVFLINLTKDHFDHGILAPMYCYEPIKYAKMKSDSKKSSAIGVIYDLEESFKNALESLSNLKKDAQ